jgi:hypothetical protein
VKRTILIAVILTWIVVSYVPAIQLSSILGKRKK